jgi:hypothetical protein
MSWQDDFQIDGKNRIGGLAVFVCLLVFLIGAASYFHHDRSSVQAISDLARERILAMKQKDGV